VPCYGGQDWNDGIMEYWNNGTEPRGIGASSRAAGDCGPRERAILEPSNRSLPEASECCELDETPLSGVSQYWSFYILQDPALPAEASGEGGDPVTQYPVPS
jgi:hypothetical protein